MTRAPARYQDPFSPPSPATRLRARSADGVHLNIEIHGDRSAPTVVLIHGWTCSIPFWAPVIRALSTDLRVVAYDQRGHGASDVPGRGHYSVQALVDDLSTVLDATLPEGEKAVLAGHSMGGMTIMAAGLSSRVMERTGGVLLTSTGFSELAAGARIFPFAARAPKLGAAFQRRLLHSSLPLGPVTPLARAALKYGTLGPGVTKELASVNAAIVHACPRSSRAAWGRVLGTVELSAGVGRLEVPTEVLVGTADRLTPPAHARAIAQALPQCEGLTELPDIGHMTPLEAPAEVSHLIRARVAKAPHSTHSTGTPQ